MFNATFNLQLYHACQFDWWRIPEYPEKNYRPAASHIVIRTHNFSGVLIAQVVENPTTTTAPIAQQLDDGCLTCKLSILFAKMTCREGSTIVQLAGLVYSRI